MTDEEMKAGDGENIVIISQVQWLSRGLAMVLSSANCFNWFPSYMSHDMILYVLYTLSSKSVTDMILKETMYLFMLHQFGSSIFLGN